MQICNICSVDLCLSISLHVSCLHVSLHVQDAKKKGKKRKGSGDDKENMKLQRRKNRQETRKELRYVHSPGFIVNLY